MALEATFRTLFLQLKKLCDTLNAILLTIGDKPPRRGAILADELDNTVLDMLGRAEDARTAARAAEKAVGSPLDLDRARRALAKCQENFHRVEQQFANELVSYEKLKNLASLGNERGGEWKAWAGGMKDAIEQGRQPLEETSKALAACWQELAERLGMTNVSVNATNIGQQITSSGSELHDLDKQGVT
jgi:hypothetical protein